MPLFGKINLREQGRRSRTKNVLSSQSYIQAKGVRVYYKLTDHMNVFMALQILKRLRLHGVMNRLLTQVAQQLLHQTIHCQASQ